MLLIFAATVGLGGCSGWCSSTVVDSAPSPDRQHDAVIFVSDCGATTSFVTQVALVPAGLSVGVRTPYVFAATTDHGAAPQGPGGGPVVKVAWTSPSAFTVRYDRRAAVFKREPSYQGISISYQFLD